MKTTLIVLVVLVIVGGVFWLMRSSDVEDAVVATPSPTSSAQPLPSATAVVSPSKSPMTTPTSTTKSVTIQGFAFAPKQLTAKKGDTIKFTNKDSVSHTVTSLTGAFESGLLSQDQSFELKTATLAPGTYEYKCTPHPSMRGTIIVQ